ncbi:MAG: Segregation and condensation protein B [Chlamydiae bacterium]|nr:Segregation and condensation protein B [Chlamydiota bacterium]
MKQAINLFEKLLEKTTKRAYYSAQKEKRRILEGLLFSSSEPIPLAKLREILTTAFPAHSDEVKTLLTELNEEYLREGRAFQIDFLAEGYLLRTREDVYPFVEALHKDRRGEKLSKAGMEVLAIIAYQSPITRREIEQIRGVDSSAVVSSLLERGLIEPIGRKEGPGRPMQYGVTKKFLQHFGLKTTQDLLSLNP